MQLPHPPVEPGTHTEPTITTGGTTSLVVANQRIIDWIRDELQRARNDNHTVSVGDAYRIAFTACEKTLRADGGL